MSYWTAALATFDNVLGTLDHIASRAEAGQIADDRLASARLAEDMFPLETQFRIAINQVYLSLNRVWEMGIPLDEAPYATFAEVRRALTAAREHVAKAKSATAADSGSRIDRTLPNGMRFELAAHELVRDWTMPNLYFHASTAYGLLRRDGLDLGKRDFLPYMLRYAVAPASA